MMFIENFHFLRPWVLLLFLVPLFLYGTYAKGAVAQSSWQKVIDKKLLDYLLIKGSAVKRKLFVNVVLLGLIGAIIAAAGPSWQKIELPTLTSQNAVMILLNMSSDMDQTDMKPSRLERAKYKIKDFLSLLKEAQVGLEVYSGEPFMIAPITEDANILVNLLPAVTKDIMPLNGDRLDRAILLAAERLREAGYHQGNLLILTADVGQKFDLALAAAQKVAEEDYKVNIIGVSATQNDKLKMIAQKGKGDYWNIRADDAKIKTLAEKINAENGQIDKSENAKTIWLDAGWYLIVIPLFCCLMLFRKGLLVVIFILYALPAQAGLFLNSNQEGLKAFEAEDYTKAADSFKDTNWRAASLYRAGDYIKSYEVYSKDNSVEGLYNQGNALAKGGKIKEAIAKYEEVLKQNPNHEDAKFNLEYLKRQQNQQQQQNKQDKDNKDNQDSSTEQNQQQNQDEQGQSNKQKQNQNEQGQGENDSQNQKQSQEQQQEQGESSQKAENSDNKQEQDKQNEQQQSTFQNQLDENQKKDEGTQQSGAMIKEGDKKENYNEKLQTKMQQYRDIPEDPGGLLKAFIYQEYRQNRYGKEAN